VTGGGRPLDRRLVTAGLGIAQILGWGTSFYFPAVFAAPIVAETGWSLGAVVSGTSIALLVAGLISPQVGKWIGRHGGRGLLVLSCVLNAAGMIGVGLATWLPVYLAAWVLVGLGVGTGLYDAAFAALGFMYGRDARGPMTNLTLIGGFASTVCWPLSAFLIDIAGWRGACFIYAALHLCLSLPAVAAVVRRGVHLAPAAVAETDGAGSFAPSPPLRNERTVFGLLAVALSISAGAGAILVINLLIFLQARGVDFAGAVALGTLHGPSQVAARLVERIFGSNYHPIWTMIASCLLMAVGLTLLSASFPLLSVIVVIFAAGYGIFWVARGTLPLALFGPARFPQLVGKLAMPSLVVQAASPSIGAFMIERYGPDATLWVLTGFAAFNLVLVATLWLVCRRANVGV
jgi:hypothetical protein